MHRSWLLTMAVPSGYQPVGAADRPNHAVESSSPESKEIAFSSPASYHPLVWCLIALGPLSTLGSIFFVYNDDSSTDNDKRKAVMALAWTTVALVIVFVFVLPTRFDVLSNGSIAVKTLPLAYKFGHVTAAYENPPLLEGWSRPRIKFATNFHNRVIVRRKQGGWDVLVSPKDPEGFTSAVWKVAAEIEADQ